MAVRIGIVGWGEIARLHAAMVRRAGARVAGVAARRCPTDLDVPWFESMEQLLPHVDGVTIAVPNDLHASSCLAAVRAGRAVMVEKPLLISAAELNDLERELPQTDVPIHVGFRMRWNSRLRELRDALQKPRRIECSYTLGIDDLASGKDWTRRQDRTGGAFFTLGVHVLDLARWLSRADGEPMADLWARADGMGDGADYPLRATVRGRLHGIQLQATTDTRDNLPYRLEVRAWHGTGSTPDQLSLDATHEVNEYEGLLRDFVEATATGRIDQRAVTEYLQVHRELLHARELAAHDNSARVPEHRGEPTS
ncbi:MAG TPA: Gfo/Idh/MocA family oxidoreductase [Acidobacteriota bacterium]|nr:Gfo/Idh/MocA family oxidoreductase [Acidobacteriota bacterium]